MINNPGIKSIQQFFPIAKRMFEALIGSKDDSKIGFELKKILTEGCAPFTKIDYQWKELFREEIKNKKDKLMKLNDKLRKHVVQ